MILKDFQIYHANSVKKIILADPTTLKIKVVEGDTAQVIANDFSNSIIDVSFINENETALISDFLEYDSGGYYITIGNTTENNARQIIRDELTYPFFLFVGEGETPTDETATKTTIFPPPETTIEFIERISAKLLHLTRRVSTLRHEEPHLSARSRRVCLDLDDRNEYVHRYDHSINLLRLPVGWTQLQINTFIARYEAHNKKVAEAKAANRTPPTFNEDRLQEQIETLINKIDSTLTEEALLEHHETHDTDEWRNAHAQRKIVLCNKDCSVGEIIADINAFHTARGETNHVLAERSFHDVAVKHWNEAKRTTHRKLVEARTYNLP